MKRLQRVVELVQERLDSGRWQQGERLPSLAVMARTFGVSRNTMFRAVAVLQESSHLHTNPRGSIIAGPRGAVDTSAATTGQIWERVKNRLGEELLRGHLGESRLPPTSKLALEYGVSIETFKKALRRLASEGVIVQAGRGYQIPANPENRRLSSMILVAASTGCTTIALGDAHTMKIVESFERECRLLNHESRQVGFDAYSPKGLLETTRVLRTMANPVGFIVAIWNPSIATYRQRWLDLIEHLSQKSLPTVILDLGGDFSLPDRHLRLPNIRILRIAGVRAGTMVADTLLRRGHTRIAYVTPYMNFRWAQARHTGLCRYYRAYGGASAKVELFARHDICNTFELAMELLNLDEAPLGLLFGKRYSPEGLSELVRISNQVKKGGLLPAIAGDERVTAVREAAAALTQFAHQSSDTATLNKMVDALYDRASTYALWIYLAPFFERIRRSTRSTALVFSDDKLAFCFIASSGGTSSSPFSLISFDNWPEAFSTGLSSYDFNIPGMVQDALAMIRDKRILKSKPLISEVDGYVIERATTRKGV